MRPTRDALATIAKVQRRSPCPAGTDPASRRPQPARCSTELMAFQDGVRGGGCFLTSFRRSIDAQFGGLRFSRFSRRRCSRNAIRRTDPPAEASVRPGSSAFRCSPGSRIPARDGVSSVRPHRRLRTSRFPDRPVRSPARRIVAKLQPQSAETVCALPIGLDPADSGHVKERPSNGRTGRAP